MSSEAITRNDLKAILEQCGMSGIAFQEAAVLNITYATVTSTTNAVENPTSSLLLGNGDVFSIDSTTNRIIVNKDCYCIIATTVVFSAVTNSNNVRLLSVGKNSTTTEFTQAAVNHSVAWHTSAAISYYKFTAGDEVHFLVRAEDGNSTLREGHSILIPIKDNVDTTTYDLCPDYIVAQPSSDYVLTTTDVTKVALDTISRSNGVKLTLDTTTNSIIVGKGVKFVEVSGEIYITTWGTAGVKNGYIYLNDTYYCRAIAQTNTNYNSLAITPTIIPVSEGDSITLRAQSQQGSTTTIGQDSRHLGASTFLQVKVVDMSGAISVKLPEDYIVEQGTEGIWTYRKWNSGIAECWGKYSKSVSANTVDSNNYVTYPFTFTATPNITVGFLAGGADYYKGYITNASGTDNTQARITLVNNYTSAVTLGLWINLMGRWK